MSSLIKKKQSDALKYTLELNPNKPLWQRVPTKDESGKYLGDFMMIIPKLKTATSEHRKNTLDALNCVLNRYQDTVVFADLNLKMNLLWVSVRPVKGIILEISSAIIESVPEAKLISDRPPSN
jgi:hypothetical protein